MNTKGLYAIIIIALLFSIVGTTLSIIEYFNNNSSEKSITDKSFPPYQADKVVIVNTNVNNTVKSPSILINSELEDISSNLYDLVIKNNSITSSQTKAIHNIKNGIINGYINKDVNNTNIIENFSMDDFYLYTPYLQAVNIDNDNTIGGLINRGNSIVSIDENKNFKVYIALIYGKPPNSSVVNNILYYSVELNDGTSTIKKETYEYSPNFIYIFMNLLSTEIKCNIDVYLALTDSLSNINLNFLSGLSFDVVTYSVSNTNEKRFTFSLLFGKINYVFNVKSIINTFIVQNTSSLNTESTIALGNIDNGCGEFNNWCRYIVLNFTFIKTGDGKNIDLTCYSYRYL